MSKKSTHDWDSIASQYNLPLSSELTALPPVVCPTFPTVAELLETQAPASSSGKPTGLFEELLQSRPEVLYVDMTEHPEKYEDGVTDLVRELVSSRRELQPEERALLDRAVLDFMASPRPKAERPKKPEPRLTLPRADEAAPVVDAPDDLPDGEARAFWWL